jgi:hypothetical protein
VNEVDSLCGRVVVVKVWSVDTAQPVKAVGIAGPDERAVVDCGEPGDPTGEALLLAAIPDALAEPTQTKPARTLDRCLEVDVVTARPHRRAIDVGHSGHRARYAAAVATFWRYVRIQLIVFVFGIVGPIFLIIFFATQPDPTMKWAYWAGLLVTAADVLIALAITAASDPNKAAADVRVAVALAKRRQSNSSDQSSSSSTYDPFSSTAFSFSSSDSGSSSSSD